MTYFTPYLRLDGVSFSFPERRVITDLSFSVPPGARAGLVGENGSGKSTLLALVAGQLAPSAGQVWRPERVGYYAQELPFPLHASVAEVLDAAQERELNALARLESTPAAQLGQALEEAERLDAYRAGARRGAALDALNLDWIQSRSHADAPVRIGQLSGGQRSRLALAAVLLAQADALILDEPGNHLDDAGMHFLERELRSFGGPVLFASHDRSLLDAVATLILDLDPSPVPAAVLGDSAAAMVQDQGTAVGVGVFSGSYTDARRERAALMRRWQQLHAAQQQEIARLRQEIEQDSRNVNRKDTPRMEARAARKFYADKDAKVMARRSRNAAVKLRSLQDRRLRQPPEPLSFAGFGPEATTAAPGAGPGFILAAREVSVPGRLKPLSLALAARERLMILGPNGSGKSTLLAILAGELAHEGDVVRLPGLRTGYLSQETRFADPQLSARQLFENSLSAGNPAPGATGSGPGPGLLSELGLLHSRDLERPVGELSPGGQRRLALAILVADPPSLLLLDEPDNHLSLSLVEELEEALDTFAGAVVLASHDRWLRQRHRSAGGAELMLSAPAPQPRPGT